MVFIVLYLLVGANICWGVWTNERPSTIEYERKYMDAIADN